jgi:hypothetical protein
VISDDPFAWFYYVLVDFLSGFMDKVSCSVDDERNWTCRTRLRQEKQRRRRAEGSNQ